MLTYTRPLSASSIDEFLGCEAKFVRHYLLGLPREVNDSLRLGRAIHQSLEHAEKELNKLHVKEVTKEFVLTIISFFRTACVQEGMSTMSLVKEGEDLIKNYFTEYDIADNVIELERYFKFTTKLGVELVGSIDKLVEIDSETIAVVDYKTSNYSKTEDELYNDIQLSVYDLAVKYLYPQYKNVVLMLHYLKKKPVCSYRSDEDRERFEGFLFDVNARIRAITVEEAREQKNQFCPWCDYKEVCKSYNAVYNLPIDKDSLHIEGDYTPEKFVNVYKTISINEKILDERKRALKLWASETLRRNGKIETEKDEVVLVQNGRVTYDVPSISRIIPSDDFSKIVSVNKKALDGYLADHPNYKKDIEKASMFNYNDFFIKVNKK